MRRLLSSGSFQLAGLLALLLAAAGGIAITTIPSAAPPLPIGGPTLTDGFSDWKLCTLESRVESHPAYFNLTHWGPASIQGASGCSCGGNPAFGGNPPTGQSPRPARPGLWTLQRTKRKPSSGIGKDNPGLRSSQPITSFAE